MAALICRDNLAAKGDRPWGALRKRFWKFVTCRSGTGGRDDTHVDSVSYCRLMQVLDP